MRFRLSASVLFEGVDLQAYIRWQAHINPSVDRLLLENPHWIPDLPTAAEFASFLRWKDRYGGVSGNDEDHNEADSSHEWSSDDEDTTIGTADADKGTGDWESEEKEKTSTFVLTLKCGHRLHPTHPAVQANLRRSSPTTSSQARSVEENLLDESSDEEADAPNNFECAGDFVDYEAQTSFLATLGSNAVRPPELTLAQQDVSQLAIEALTIDQNNQRRSSPDFDMPAAGEVGLPTVQNAENRTSPEIDIRTAEADVLIVQSTEDRSSLEIDMHAVEEADWPIVQPVETLGPPPWTVFSAHPVDSSTPEESPRSIVGPPSAEAGGPSSFSAPAPYNERSASFDVLPATPRLTPTELNRSSSGSSLDSPPGSSSGSSSSYSVLSTPGTVREDYCPVCTIRQHLILLDLIRVKWVEIGGPWKRGDQQPLYGPRERAWYRTKCALVNAITQLEVWAEAEEVYDLWHESEIRTMVGTPKGAEWEDVKAHGAREAIRIARRDSLYPAPFVGSDGDVGWSHYHLSDQYQSRSRWSGQPKKERVKLHFVPETVENERRMIGKYHRNGPRYEASHDRHVCPNPEGWADTSFMGSWQYTITQCRTVLVHPNIEDPSHLRYKHLNAGPDFGDNPATRRLVHLLEVWFMERQLDPAALDYWVKLLGKTSAVWRVHQKNPYARNEQDYFDEFDLRESFEGSDLEWWARQIGDLDPLPPADSSSPPSEAGPSGLEVQNAEDEPNLDEFFRELDSASSMQEDDELATVVYVDEVEQEEEREHLDPSQRPHGFEQIAKLEQCPTLEQSPTLEQIPGLEQIQRIGQADRFDSPQNEDEVASGSHVDDRQPVINAIGMARRDSEAALDTATQSLVAHAGQDYREEEEKKRKGTDGSEQGSSGEKNKRAKINNEDMDVESNRQGE